MASTRDLQQNSSQRSIQGLVQEEVDRLHRLESVAAAAVRSAEKVQVIYPPPPPPTLSWGPSPLECTVLTRDQYCALPE